MKCFGVEGWGSSTTWLTEELCAERTGQVGIQVYSLVWSRNELWWKLLCSFWFVWVLFFPKGIQDTCVGGMVFFILWLMTLEESTCRVWFITFLFCSWSMEYSVACPCLVQDYNATERGIFRIASQKFGNTFILKKQCASKLHSWHFVLFLLILFPEGLAEDAV